MKKRGRQRRKWWKLVLLVGIAGPPALVLLSNMLVVVIGGVRIEETVDEVPPGEVALVLGAGPGSTAVIRRLEAGVELWESGRVQFLLVSGGADGTGYGETEYMQRYLREKGVPDRAVMVDTLGLRTLDSVLRARDVFGVRRVVLVTQRYHLYRAVFLARAAGLRARGYVAAGLEGTESRNALGREYLARVRAVLDVITRQPARHPKTLSYEMVDEENPDIGVPSDGEELLAHFPLNRE